MKKVVIITNIMSPYRVDLFNNLSLDNELDITVIYSSNNEDREWKIESVNHKYKVLKSKTIKFKHKLDYKYIHIPKDIISILNDINPDVIVGSEYNPTIILAYIWTKFKSNKKFVSWSDGTLHSERNINYIQRKLRNIICRGADSLIASSTKTKEAQLHYGAKNKIFISYLTIDTEKYFIKKDNWDNKNLLYVGRLIELKGLDLLINALSKVKNDYKLTIVGSGEEEENLKLLTREMKVDNKIDFVGFKQRKELVDIYAKSDIFILPTRQDCFGLVINEAMCAGLPVISSKYADGAYDLIDENVGGYIIDPYDVDEFSTKIDTILSDKKLLKTMSIYNQKKIKQFSIARVSEPYIDAIKYVCGK